MRIQKLGRLYFIINGHGLIVREFRTLKAAQAYCANKKATV